MTKLGPIVGTLVNFLMVMTCTVLSFYAMQVLSVKILLESESHKIRDRKVKKHQRDGVIIVTLITICLMANSVAASIGSVRWDQFSFMIYRVLTLFMLIKLAFSIPFFLKRKKGESLDLWVFSLLFVNLAVQLASFVRPMIRFLATFGVINYSSELDYPISFTMKIMLGIADLLTSLSILYLHHRMGLRQITPKKKVNLYHDSQGELPEELTLNQKSKYQVVNTSPLSTDIQVE